MSIEYRIISIGALAAHPLWNERGDVRSAHATTTLVSAGDERILIDPSLPAQILVARLHERSGLSPDAITQVFLTSFEPFRRRGLGAFTAAKWWLSERERDVADRAVGQALEGAEAAGDAALIEAFRQEQAVLERCGAAPDALARGVDLFPLPGVTAGTCALLLALPASTVLICGDTVPTWEHLAEGKVLAQCADHERAQESFREAIEIADVLVLGRDNVVPSPLRPGGM